MPHNRRPINNGQNPVVRPYTAVEKAPRNKESTNTVRFARRSLTQPATGLARRRMKRLAERSTPTLTRATPATAVCVGNTVYRAESPTSEKAVPIPVGRIMRQGEVGLIFDFSDMNDVV